MYAPQYLYLVLDAGLRPCKFSIYRDPKEVCQTHIVFIQLFIMSFKCLKCLRTFTSGKNRSIHVSKAHGREKPECLRPQNEPPLKRRKSASAELEQACPSGHPTPEQNTSQPQPWIPINNVIPAQTGGPTPTSVPETPKDLPVEVNRPVSAHPHEPPTTIDVACADAVQDDPNPQQHTTGHEDAKLMIIEEVENIRRETRKDIQSLKDATDHVLQQSSDATKAWADASWNIWNTELQTFHHTLASTKITADHALSTASLRQDRFDDLDRRVGGLDDILNERLLSFLDNLKENEIGPLERVLKSTNSLADKAMLAASYNEDRSNVLQAEMRNHMTLMTRWGTDANYRFETFVNDVRANELAPLAQSLKMLEEKMDKTNKDQLHLASMMEDRILELDDIKTTLSDPGLKFQVSVSLREVQAPEEEDCAHGIVSLNMTQRDMLHMDN
jgi:hypothetical protein